MTATFINRHTPTTQQDVNAGFDAFQQVEAALKARFNAIEFHRGMTTTDRDTIIRLVQSIRNLAKCFFGKVVEQDQFKSDCHILGQELAGIVATQMVDHTREMAASAVSETARSEFERNAKVWVASDANTVLSCIEVSLGYKESGQDGPLRALLKI